MHLLNNNPLFIRNNPFQNYIVTQELRFLPHSIIGTVLLCTWLINLAQSPYEMG